MILYVGLSIDYIFPFLIIYGLRYLFHRMRRSLSLSPHATFHLDKVSPSTILGLSHALGSSSQQILMQTSRALLLHSCNLTTKPRPFPAQAAPAPMAGPPSSTYVKLPWRSNSRETHGLPALSLIGMP